MDSWWIDRPKMLGSDNPTTDDLEQLREQGFDIIVSLLLEDEQQPRYDVDRAREIGFVRHSFPVRDLTAPTVEQLKEFQDLVLALASESKLLIHCQAGIGRTGTFAAAYWISRGMSVEDAVALVRKARWGAIETTAQEAVLRRFAQEIMGA